MQYKGKYSETDLKAIYDRMPKIQSALAPLGEEIVRGLIHEQQCGNGNDVEITLLPIDAMFLTEHDIPVYPATDHMILNEYTEDAEIDWETRLCKVDGTRKQKYLIKPERAEEALDKLIEYYHARKNRKIK